MLASLLSHNAKLLWRPVTVMLLTILSISHISIVMANGTSGSDSKHIQINAHVAFGSDVYIPLQKYLNIEYSNAQTEALKNNVCVQKPNENEDVNLVTPQAVTFRNVAHEVGLHSRQAQVKTSPNCIFPQWDKKLRRWDSGGFCMEETLTGGACIGDANGDGYDDLYYPRMDGSDVLYINRKDGTGLDDTTKLSNLYYPKIRSNGCQFIDVDNDGDNDIYVSTLGDTRFYLFINDGTGRFAEDAYNRGLANIVRNGTRMTAGFTIAVADIDNDGDLDIATTEWRPWLDGEDLQSESAKAFIEKQPNSSWTNARLFENLGPEKVGYFKDITVSAGVMPKFRLQQRRPDFTAYACKHIGPKALCNLLRGLGLYVSDKYQLEEHILREKFIILRQMMRRGTRSVHTMKHTSNLSNVGDYKHFSTNTIDLKQARKLYVVVLYNGDATSDVDFENTLTLYAAGRSNQSPIAVPKRNHEWVAKAGEILALDVGGAYGGRKFHFGIRCHVKNGCPFELLTLTSDSASNSLKDDICGDGTKKVELHKDAGPFKVDLVVPWVTSERFVTYAMGRMNDLEYSPGMQRDVLRQLMQHSDKLDVERFARVSQTQVRLQRAVHESKKWILTTEDGSKEASWLQALTGVNQGGVTGKKRMNHATEFPLVGAFEFAAKFTDIDGDGTADLIISGDFGTSQMYWGNGNKTFKSGFFNIVEDGFDNSMGATVGDWDMDGQLDVLFTSTSISDSDLKTLNSVASTAGLLLSFRGNHLYRYVGGRRFEDVTTFTGVRESGWGWGAFFFDFDNDGDLDALNGNGMDDPETTDMTGRSIKICDYMLTKERMKGFGLKKKRNLVILRAQQRIERR